MSITKLRKFARLSDRALLRVLAALLAKERAFTADVVACIAEVELRQLYRAAGPGTVTISATSRPVCNPGQVCPQFIRAWRVTVVVDA